MKRSSFSHENEVRLFILPKIDSSNVDSFESKPVIVKVKALDLIEEIYISPFSREPFASSIKAICNKYSLPQDIVKESNLLEGHKELLESIAKF